MNDDTKQTRRKVNEHAEGIAQISILLFRIIHMTESMFEPSLRTVLTTIHRMKWCKEIDVEESLHGAELRT